jgi:hypothetical protein
MTFVARSGRLAAKVSLFLAVSLALTGSGAWAEAKLALVRRTTLVKATGRIDQAVALPVGGFLVRDADLLKEATQALEVYDSSGRFVRKIGGYGPRPGNYQALKQIALGTDGTVWAADLIGRLSFFDLGGRLADTKLIQAPGYQVEGLALDEPRGFFYLSGCLPMNTYLDRGCKVVHQYRLKDRKYVGSYVDNDPQLREKSLLSFSDNALDVDAQGLVWVVDAPVMKLSRLDPGTGKTEGFAVRSALAKPLSKVEPGADTEALYRNAYLLERVITVPGAVVVSIRGPQNFSLLEVFDPQGRQISVDLPPPRQARREDAQRTSSLRRACERRV